jgi:peptidoglycan/xylan/chitin deacetylase (PgdA/CDA1 family)
VTAPTNGRKRVALTFDAEHPDRPTSAGGAERLLDILAATGVRATFFVQGRWAEAYPRTARAIADGGHLIGNHSHYHARMPMLSDDGLAEDIRDAGTAIREHVGSDPLPWFRCPFGSGATDARVQAAVSAAGYRHVGWHVAAEDWEPHRDGPTIEADIVRDVTEHGDGAVVLLHTWPRGTVEATPAIVTRLRDDGWSFVRVDELDDIPVTPSWRE